MDDDAIELNRASWDERVPVHVESDFYDDLPPGAPRVPLMYSLKARRPTDG